MFTGACFHPAEVSAPKAGGTRCRNPVWVAVMGTGVDENRDPLADVVLPL
jgi:hypothetical protein